MISVWLKDEDLNSRLLEYMKESDNVAAQLVNKSTFNKYLMGSELKRVHESLRLKLKNQRRNGLRSMVASHLYDLMPETAEQRRWFPKITITLDSTYAFSFNTQMRQ